MPYRNGCSIDGYDFGQGDGFNWTALKEHMTAIGVTIPRERMYRMQIYLQDRPGEPAKMLVELSYEQDGKGAWQPVMKPGTNPYSLTTGDNPRYIVNGHIYDGQRVFAVLLDL